MSQDLQQADASIRFYFVDVGGTGITGYLRIFIIGTDHQSVPAKVDGKSEVSFVTRIGRVQGGSELGGAICVYFV